MPNSTAYKNFNMKRRQPVEIGWRFRVTAFGLKENMKKAAQKGYINATDCADYLVKKGMAFRDAYKITGQIVGYCIDNNKTLDSLSLQEYKNICNLFENDIYEQIDLINCLKARTVEGGPAPEKIMNHIMI